MVTALVAEVMQGPWVWGKSDCCAAACDVFARLHGRDPMKAYRGRYSTQRGALRLIARAGGFDNLAAMLAADAGLRPSGWAPGALGVANIDGPALVIGVDHGLWAGRIDGGFQTLPDGGVRLAWSV